MTDRPAIDLDSPLVLDGEEWTITARIGASKVVAERSGSPPRVLSTEEVRIARGGPIAKEDDAGAGKAAPRRRRDLADITEGEWAVALARHPIVQGLADLAGRRRADVAVAARMAKVDVSTVYEWLKVFEPDRLVTDLIPRKAGRKTGTRMLPEAIETIISEQIEEVLKLKKPTTVPKLMEGVRAACRAAGLKAPSENTVRARLADLDPEETLIRLGHRDRARNKFRPTRGRFPGADSPLAVVQIDHTRGDLELVDETHRLPIGRPWMTLAIDVHTRILLGLYISFDAPSAAAVGFCIANAILPKRPYLAELDVPGEWPCQGMPGTIHVDNAKEFKGEVLKGACTKRVITLALRPVKTPHYGGHIERLMKTSGDEIHCLPGTTFSNPQKRGQHKPAETAAMTLREFEAYFVDWAVNKYNAKRHSQIDVTPLHAYRKATVGTDDTPAIGVAEVDDERQLRLDFMPFVRRAVDRHGVVVDYVEYWSDVLKSKVKEGYSIIDGSPRARREPIKYVFRYDPRDMSVLYMWDPDTAQYYDVPFKEMGRPAVSRFEIIQAKERLRREGLANFDEDKLFETIARLRERVEASVERTRQARKAAATAKRAATMAARRAAETGKDQGSGAPSPARGGKPGDQRDRADDVSAPEATPPSSRLDDPFTRPIRPFAVAGDLRTTRAPEDSP